MIKNRLFDLLMPLLPKNDLSHLVGRAVHLKMPGPLAQASVLAFAKYYNIDLNEAEKPVEQYASIGDLFTRKLKPGLRPVGAGIVHPADAVITQACVISKDRSIQAKGKDYSVSELLRSSHWAEVFEGGTAITYYLCPTDYHRVHTPIGGKVTWLMHVPGELWPVNDWSVQAIENLFAVNERIIGVMDSREADTTAYQDEGRAALVMVAATNVGNMSLSFDESVETRDRRGERQAREKTYGEPPLLRKGDEFGIFHMGSTVVMLYEKGMVEGDLSSLIGQSVRVGASLSECLAKVSTNV
jgi:phosphatidylserine decarboxylase